MIDQLLCVRLFHSFFSSGKLEDISFVPTAPTALLIERYRLLPRMENGVFSLNTTAPQGAPQLLRYLLAQDGQARLDFQLMCELSHFSFITETAPDWFGQMTFSSRTAQADGVNLHLQLASVGEVNPANVLGLVSIYLADLLRFGGKDISYVFYFQARKLRWAYCVVNRSRIKLADPGIGNQDGFAFQGPQEVVLPNGEQGLRFHSGTEAFPLQEVPALWSI